MIAYCQDRGIDDTEQPLTPALSPSDGEREKPRRAPCHFLIQRQCTPDVSPLEGERE